MAVKPFALVNIALSAAVSMGVCAQAQADVILHAFNWKYSDVTARAEAIKTAGYKKVLVAPAYKSAGSAWWARYQPQDARVISHPLGDTASFKTMIKALGDRGVQVYADVLLNHMANESGVRSDLNYPGQAVLNAYAANSAYFNTQKLFGDLRYNYLSSFDFGPQVCITDYNNVYQVQNYRLCGGGADVGLPDLLASDYVSTQQQAYLDALKTMGVKGFRIDAAKHMSNAQINKVLTPTIKSGVHVFGEVITGGGSGNGDFDNFLKPYLDGTDHGAYDFPLHNTLRLAFGFGGSMNRLVDPGAYGQALAGTRAVTFTVTHDIPNNSGFRYLIMDPTDETLAYAYLMGRNGGVPMVYSDNNESNDASRWVDAYNRGDIKNMIRFHNATQGSDQAILSYSDCHILFRRGSLGIVGINKCGSSVSTTINMNNSVLWWNTDYRDTLSSNVVRIASSSYTFALPARSARMWVR